jgi:hypothetical protein
MKHWRGAWKVRLILDQTPNGSITSIGSRSRGYSRNQVRGLKAHGTKPAMNEGKGAWLAAIRGFPSYTTTPLAP